MIESFYVFFLSFCAILSFQVHPSLYNMGGQPLPSVKIGVNWYASGTVPPDSAEEFAELLKKAAKIAREFPYHGYRIEF